MNRRHFLATTIASSLAFAAGGTNLTVNAADLTNVTTLTGGACPVPNGNVQEQACYPCTDSSTCGPGRPGVCRRGVRP